MTDPEPHTILVQSALHPRLADMLQRVRAAELTATGPDRRVTFRLTRELLSAASRLGIPTHQLADCLGCTPSAISSRTTRHDGLMPPELLRQLTDLTPNELDTLSGGELTRHHDRSTPDHSYPTTDVIRALICTPPNDPTPHSRATAPP